MPVVNFHHYKSAEALAAAFGANWMYVGRANRGYGLKASPLANPFVDSPRKRGRVVKDPVEFYRQWLWGKIKNGDTAVLEALQQIDGNTALVCWCAPSPCHAEVIELAAAWLRNNEQPAAQHESAQFNASQPEIKVITLWQPWATLMALRLKHFETRSWATNYRGLLAIHAAARPVRWESEVNITMGVYLREYGLRSRDDFPYKAIVGVGNLTGCYATPTVWGDEIAYSSGVTLPPGRPESDFGNYAPGRYAWHVPDVVGFKEPIPCSGAQGLWTPDDEVRAQVLERYLCAQEASH